VDIKKVRHQIFFLKHAGELRLVILRRKRDKESSQRFYMTKGGGKNPKLLPGNAHTITWETKKSLGVVGEEMSHSSSPSQFPLV
jgi:hypothetical protein